MKATGRTIVFGTREALTYCSTFAFDSKCGMPVFRSAEATLDRTTCLTDAAFAASIAVVPCRTSFSGWTEKSGSNGVVTTKKPSTFRRSGARLARWVRSPCAPSIPAAARAFNFEALRVRPITRCPRLRRLRATVPPCCPVAPATRIVFVSAMRSSRGPQTSVLLVLLDEADRLEIGEFPEIGHDPEFRDEPLLVRLADVREMDFRTTALQIELELIRKAIVHVDDRAHALLGGLGLPRRLHDVLQCLAGKRVVEVDPDATRAHGGDEAVFPADRDFLPDFRADLLPEKFPFRAKLDEPRVSDPCTLLRGNQHLDRLPDLRPDEGRFEAFEQPTSADDHGDLDVDFLLVELPLFLGGLVVGRVEEGQGPVGIHRPGVVINPDDVPFLDRFGGHAPHGKNACP